MSNVVELTPKESRVDQASQWIARLDRELSSDETEALNKWLAAHPDNRAMLLEMADLWDKMGSLERLASLFPEPVENLHSYSKYGFARIATAAMLLVVGLGLVGVVGWGYLSADGAGVAYQTDIGEHSSVTLSDGTKMTLNTNSMVTVEYTRRARLLTLERGEVFVEVAKDKTRPLSVFARKQMVQAVGTAFSVAIDNDRTVELMVLEGKVKAGVMTSSPLHILPFSAGPDAPATIVAAGQSLLLGSLDEKIKAVPLEEMNVKLAWRSGNLVFRGESLGEAIHEIERYTSVDLVFMDESLKQIRVAGLFRAGDVNGLLATLKEHFKIDYRYVDDKKVELTSQSQDK